MEIISLTPKNPQKQTIYKNEDIKTCVNGVVPLDADYTRYFMNIWDDDTISIDESFVDINQSIEFELSLYSNNNHVVILSGTTVGTLPINPGVTKLKYSRPKGYAVWLVDVSTESYPPSSLYARSRVVGQGLRAISCTSCPSSSSIADLCDLFSQTSATYQETSSNAFAWYKVGDDVEITLETISPTLLTGLILHYGPIDPATTAYPTSMKIFGSNDGRNWSKILDENDLGIAASTNVELKTNANSAPFRMFKFVVTNQTIRVALPYITLLGVSFSQLDVGSFYNVFPLISTAINGYSAEVNSSELSSSSSVYNFINGSGEASRSSMATPFKFTFHLPAAESICGFSFRVSDYSTYYDSRNPTWFAIFGSNDGEEWSKVAEYREKFQNTGRPSYYTMLFPQTAEFSNYKLEIYQVGNGGTSNTLAAGNFMLIGRQTGGYNDFKTIIPPMANNIQGGYTVSSSDESYSATYRAYDDNVSTEMGGNFGGDGKWWTQIQLPLATVVKGFQLVASSDKEYAPTSFIFQGSEDGEEWVDIQEYTPVWSFSNEVQNYEVENTNAYTYYRWLVSSTVNGSSVRLATIGLSTNPGDKAFKTFTDEYLCPPLPSDNSIIPLSDNSYVTPIMSSNSQSGYNITGSSAYNDAYAFWKAFNRSSSSSNDAWASLNKTDSSGNCNEWLQIELPAAKTAKFVTISPRHDLPTQAPNSFSISGSNDGTQWTELLTQSGVTWSADTPKMFSLNNNSDYLYYKITITKTNRGNDNVAIGQFNLLIDEPKEYKVSATSEYDFSEGAWRAFDHTTAQWTSRVRNNVELILELPEAMSCNTIVLTGSNATSRSPSIFHIDGSNDKTEWTILYNQETSAGFGASEKRVYRNDNETPYKYYRLYVVSNSGDGSFMSVQELSFINRTIIEE